MLKKIVIGTVAFCAVGGAIGAVAGANNASKVASVNPAPTASAAPVQNTTPSQAPGVTQLPATSPITQPDPQTEEQQTAANIVSCMRKVTWNKKPAITDASVSAFFGRAQVKLFSRVPDTLDGMNFARLALNGFEKSCAGTSTGYVELLGPDGSLVGNDNY